MNIQELKKETSEHLIAKAENPREVYVKKLGIIPIGGVKKSMDYILKNLGQRQKVEIIDDGARILLREN